MNEFVEECRREWRRLGIPEEVADEMGAELSADLAEAAEESASIEDVLGNSALDPRAFATAWAAERALDGPPPDGGSRRRRSIVAAAAIAALVCTAIVGGALVLFGSAAGSARVALTGPSLPDGHRRPVVTVAAPPPAAGMIFTIDGRRLPATVWVTAPAVSPDGKMIAVPAHPSRIHALGVADSGVDARTLGWVLVAFSLAGLASAATLLVWETAARPGSRAAGGRPPARA